MPEITRESSRPGSLLSNTNRVEAPFVRVEIEGYSFGVYETKSRNANPIDKYPNYIKSLQVRKINGTVNQYTLTIDYPITENDDPNFFDKLFSKASYSRKIKFIYGDATMPNFIYRDEEAIITKVRNSFDIRGSKITYAIEAVSASKLTLSGNYRFPAITAKPSDIIKQKIKDTRYNLQEVFTGLRNMSDRDLNNLIASDDKKVRISTCANMSILEYLTYLVSCMVPAGSNSESIVKSNVYTLTTFDSDKGAYFKVQKVQRAESVLNQLCTYDVDIGYMSANVVTSFNINTDENWSIFYNYNQDLGTSDYLTRIDNQGNLEKIYSPSLANSDFKITAKDSDWWTQVTQYPIKATITLKGLLRPVVLMQYIRLNVYFYNHKHISSGVYIVTSQTDSISTSGYSTTLELVRVGGV